MAVVKKNLFLRYVFFNFRPEHFSEFLFVWTMFCTSLTTGAPSTRVIIVALRKYHKDLRVDFSDRLLGKK